MIKINNIYKHFFLAGFLLFLVAFFLGAGENQILAQDNSTPPDAGYTTTISATYDFATSASTKVNLDYTLTNTSATTFVQSYQVNLPHSNLTGLVLQPKDQEIDSQETIADNHTIMDLTFLNQVVGQGQERQFALEYSDSNLITIRGKHIVIKIPPPTSDPTLNSYTAQVTVPTSFGVPDIITPTPTDTIPRAGETIYQFSQTTPAEITFQYGDKQIAQFDFSVPLHNQKSTSLYHQVTLPLDSDQEKLFYATLYPYPTYHQVIDNSWQLFYLLRPGEQITVAGNGYLELSDVTHEYDFQAQLDPTLQNSWSMFYIDDIPADFRQTVATPPTLALDLDRWWIIPLPGFLQAQIHNHTGQTWTNLSLHAHSSDQQITLDPSQITPEPLLPYSSQNLSLNLESQNWWPLYAETQVQLQLLDASGTIIDETEFTSFTIAYGTLALIGGILAAAFTTGSILVARRRK